MSKRMIHFAVTLGLICAVAALGVAGTYRFTRTRIQQRLEDKQNEALALLFDAAGAYPAGVAAGKGDERVFKAVPCLLRPSDVLDWPVFCAELSEEGAKGARTVGGRIKDILPAEVKALARTLVEKKTSDDTTKAKIISALNQIIERRDCCSEQARGGVSPPAAAAELLRMDRKSLPLRDIRRLNRILLEAAFPEKIRKAQEQVAAYAAVGTGQGYSSRIRVLAAADPSCRKVLAVIITYQSETPGLGSQVTDVKPDTTWGRVFAGERNPIQAIASHYEPPRDLGSLSAFQRQFAGKPAGSIELHGGVNAISGATVSSRAVVNAVNEALARIRKAIPSGAAN